MNLNLFKITVWEDNELAGKMGIVMGNTCISFGSISISPVGISAFGALLFITLPKTEITDSL